MHRVVRSAEIARRALGITEGVAAPRQIEQAVSELAELEVRDVGFTGDVWGVLVRCEPTWRRQDVAFVRAGMDPYQRAYVVGHEMGHYLLGHEGNHAFRALPWTLLARNCGRYEREAMVWVLTLICGAPVGPRFEERLREAVAEGYPATYLLQSLQAHRLEHGEPLDGMRAVDGQEVSLLPLP